MLACFGGRREKTKERKRDEREGARDVRVLHGDVQSAEERAEGEEVRGVADVEREGEADNDLERDHEDSQLGHERGPAPVRQIPTSAQKICPHSVGGSHSARLMSVR